MQADSNQFQFSKDQTHSELLSLNAQITDFNYHKHSHEEYSFGVTLTGRQDFFAAGGFHRSPPGTVIVFNPDETHDGHSGVDDALSYRMLYVHPSKLEPMLSAAGLPNSRDFQVKEKLISNASLRSRILNISTLLEKNSEDALQLECELFHLAEELVKHSKAYVPESSVKRTESLLGKAKEFMQKNITANLSLEDISQTVHLSKYHFLRLFKAQFGLTPHQYLLNCRVNQARKALEAGITAEEVVFTFGFSDLSHFNRRFKAIYGVTAKQYQQLVLTDSS